MRLVVSLLALLAALVTLPACGGDDDDDSAAPGTTTTLAERTGSEPATTGETETDAAEGGEDGDTEAGGGETVGPAVIAGAARRTAEAGSARVATTVRLSGDGFDEQAFGGEGVFDFREQAGEVALDLGGLDDATFSSARVIFADHAVYYGLPTGFLPGGQRWLKLDLQSVADATAVDFGSLFLGAQADPGQYLLWLHALGPDVERAGEETVRGVETTRYRAVVDLEALAGQAPAGREDEWAAYVESTRQRLGLDEIPGEIWVDADGLVRRMRQEYAFGDGVSSTATVTTTELWDFGVDVDVSAPSPDNVTDVTDLVRP